MQLDGHDRDPFDPENATYVRCTKQELQLVMDAIAQRKEESLEFKERAIEAFNVQNFKRAEQHECSQAVLPLLALGAQVAEHASGGRLMARALLRAT